MTTETIHTPPQKKTGLRNPFIVRRLNAHIHEALTTGQPLPQNAARVLAACFHPGIESALCSFAAAGRLDAQRAGRELETLPGSLRSDPGLRALSDYVRSRIEATTTPPKGDAAHGTSIQPR